MNSLGEKYLEEGKRFFVNQDYVKARESFKKAADLEIPAAQFYYGVMVFKGIGGEEDIDKGIESIADAKYNGFREADEYLYNLRRKAEARLSKLEGPSLWFKIPR